MMQRFATLALTATALGLLSTSCYMPDLYRPRAITLPEVPPTAQRYSIPVLWKTRGFETFNSVSVPGALVVANLRRANEFLTQHANASFEQASMFSRALRPDDPPPSTFFEIIAKPSSFKFERDKARKWRAVGEMTFTGSLWPTASKLWSTTIAVGPNDYANLKTPPPTWRDALDQYFSYILAKLAHELSTSPQLATALKDAEESNLFFARRNAPMPKAGAPSTTAIVALFDLEIKGLELTSIELTGLNNYLGATLAESRRFEVVPREALLYVLRRQKKESYKDCYNEACQIEIGKELAAEKSLSGTIVEFGGQCLITLRLFDLKKATQEFAGTAKSDCARDALLTAIETATRKLTEAPPSNRL